MIQVVCNGNRYEIPEKQTVLEFTSQLALAEKRFAIEINQKIIPQGLYHETILHPGDTIEIVRAIGGG